MTEAELTEMFVQRKAQRTALTWAQFAAAVGGANEEVKARILAVINDPSPVAAEALGKGLIQLAGLKKQELARSAVLLMLADGQVSVPELLDLLA